MSGHPTLQVAKNCEPRDDCDNQQRLIRGEQQDSKKW
jgi:hypothetical protein